MRIYEDLMRKKPILAAAEAEALGDPFAASTGPGLVKVLCARDLTALGIAAIIGAGIFSAIGNAAYWGGPAIIFLFIFTSFACGCTAMCYAQFASLIPASGSAYTYAYVAFGEFIAWVMGWDLLMEYAIGNIAVAISWSNYFVELLAGYGLAIPDHLTMDYRTALNGAMAVKERIAAGQNLQELMALPGVAPFIRSYRAWEFAPDILGYRVIFNLPALFIVAMVTALIYVGTQESKKVSNAMVLVKVMTILLVIVAGIFYVKPANWNPFAPNGIGGVMKGVSGIFFAYIGFDALSTTAEECRNPQRDLPRAMFGSLGICTLLYVALALVLTGMVHYSRLQVGDPLAFAFGRLGADVQWLMGIIAASAVVAMASVLLVFMLGQPRIWMAMSRDGLLPRCFCVIHRRFRTPTLATLATGLSVAVPSLFFNLSEVTDLTSIGTLFAFSIVCAGTLVLDGNDRPEPQRFRVPYIDSRYIFAPLLIAIGGALLVFCPETFLQSLTTSSAPGVRLGTILFLLFSATLAYLSFVRRLSLIPLMGLESCVYLMTELTGACWLRFSIWIVLGLFVYFLYGRRKSKLNTAGLR
ncbi:MAG: putative amino acid permease YhdG [Syntrophorhabdus sp. PtaB.Bin184]|nr:MAG: putative amino acid permease YhdG [Syntrophorhabdus sp. PtaB.Bin184]